MTSSVDPRDGDDSAPSDGVEGAAAIAADDPRRVTDPAELDDSAVGSDSLVLESPISPSAVDVPPASEGRHSGRPPEASVRSRAPAEDALAHASAREVAQAVCPYLASAGGAWRMAVPSRDHRCVGLQPPVPQPPDKQRRHCLSPAHVECGIYRAARDVRAVTLAGGGDPARVVRADASRRPLPRTAPILLEAPRLLDQAARLRFDRAPGQLALVGLMVVAFAIVGLSRLSGTPAASPVPSLVAVLPSGSVAPPSPRPTPTPAPSASASSVASGSAPAPSFRTTYTVKKGDTLNAVATRFKTTATAIRRLNNLKSSTLRIGQVLKIP